jgi:hypothetical protein
MWFKVAKMDFCIAWKGFLEKEERESALRRAPKSYANVPFIPYIEEYSSVRYGANKGNGFQKRGF